MKIMVHLKWLMIHQTTSSFWTSVLYIFLLIRQVVTMARAPQTESNEFSLI